MIADLAVMSYSPDESARKADEGRRAHFAPDPVRPAVVERPSDHYERPSDVYAAAAAKFALPRPGAWAGQERFNVSST
mgnify:CR=1 FL=1